VREATVKGKIPLVFWDEFDSEHLKWLKDFLAPMQDGRFLDAGVEFSLGKVIFVFAGGTAKTFSEFDRLRELESTRIAFSESKGPDFISRLSGYVNVKGPNPIDLDEEPQEATALIAGRGSPPRGTSVSVSRLVRDPRESNDQAYVMRRAILLRSAIERFQPRLIPAGSNYAAISRDVVRGFLWARKFHHGARSLESIVRTSAVGESRFYGVSALPSRDLLKLHASDDFMDRVEEAASELGNVELTEQVDCLIASLVKSSGSETELSDWRTRFRVALGTLHRLGYRARLASANPRSFLRSPAEDCGDECIREIHEIWLRERLARGFAQNPTRNARLRVQPDVVCFAGLAQQTKEQYRTLLSKVPSVFAACGYALEPARAQRCSQGFRARLRAILRSAVQMPFGLVLHHGGFE
jgi:hypothetical protein